jgi:hypothetical protein
MRQAPIRGHRRGVPVPRTNGRLSEPAYNGAVSRKDFAVDLRIRTRHTFVRGL